MTIKEVEERCGMDRANIRFYEKEGLVSPVRQENGYRDYSEADVQMLLRIKLLRSLHFSLEEIRKLAQGEEELTAVLARKVHELEQERQELNYAKELCRTMQQDQVRFTNLDADKYLDQARRTVPEGSGIGKVTKEDRLPGVFRPWRRYFARGLDLSICGLLWTA
ncbi:MAG: MerR family transcriptional regulator, partial [Clostridia bacterium]|nr:MerR family transcriptional regulator [Clostridia bacterium]